MNGKKISFGRTTTKHDNTSPRPHKNNNNINTSLDEVVNILISILFNINSKLTSTDRPMIKRSELRRKIVSIILLIMIPMALCFRAPILSSSRLVGRYSASRLLDSLDSNTQSRLPTNQELVERRLETQRAKKESQERTIQERFDRNIRLKRLLHTQSTENNDADSPDEFQVPPLYAVKIWVADDLRHELKLSGREKRGRVFIELASDGVQSIKGLKSEMHAFFAALKKDSYLLAASLPTLAPDGTLLASDASNLTQSSWPIETDADVVKTFQAADQFFATCDSLKRPSIQISVLKNPNAPPPPTPPMYLDNMPDPKASETMTMLSFYAFPPAGIADPDAFAYDLSKRWKPFQTVGRVYVAQEGVNAQMSIPTNVLENFMQCCRSVPEFEFMENGINIDPVPLTVEEFQEAGVAVNGKPAPPFKNLHVRVRKQVVADGLDKPLNWQSAGYDMPPMEWHAKLKEAREKRAQAEAADDVPILLDCRNSYETDVGIFDGAEPLDTENFRESWDVLKERLAETPKDAPIMTYCTGGIRCVKVGAYLTQELGFTNVSRLAGGIIAYDRTLSEKAQGEEPMFKGTNFVFDGRLGRQITEDSLAECITCGAETSMVSNCRNDSCHKRMVQCEKCRTSFHGSCSDACKSRIAIGAMAPHKPLMAEALNQATRKFDSIEDYSLGHSSPTPSIYNEMELNTQAYLPTGSHMVSGSAQGRLLTQLTSMSREGRVLEFGTFTGYATACFLEGARNAGQATGATSGNADSGPYVLSMERDARAFNLAAAHLRVLSEQGLGEAGAEAACALRNDVPEVKEDMVSVSLDGIAGCDLLRVSDALATVEAMASGSGDFLPAPFDVVFVDADKTRLLEYVEACLNSDRVLKRGGVIVVDNVLWKGLVLEASSGGFSSVADTPDTEKDELRKNRRARRLATQMHQFNAAIVQDDRVEVLMFPMRDGLSVIRKR